MINKQTEWGFYGGNKVKQDTKTAGKGFQVQMEYGESIYLEYHEAQSLCSLLTKILWKSNGKRKKKSSKTKEKQ